MDIQELSTIFGSKTKAQEILFLLHDLKPAVRQGFYASELPLVEDFCQKKGLFLVKSTFKVLLSDHEHFSNQGLRIPESDPRTGMYFIYISKDEETALLAAYYELVQNDPELGLTLGYPECCIDYFLNHFSLENSNPEITSKNLFTNLSQRHEDCVLLSHFPCSAECLKSIEIGQKNLELLQKVDSVRAKEMIDSLGK